MMRRSVRIYAPYLPSDTTAAAVRLADLLVTEGLRVDYAATNLRPKNTYRHWDGRVKTQLFESQDPQIWFVPPSASQLLQMTSTNTPFVLIDNSHFPCRHVPGAEQLAVAVIQPNRQGPNVYDQIGDKTIAIPWDIGGQWQCLRDANSVPRVLVPLHQMYWKLLHPYYVRIAAEAASSCGGQVVVTTSPHWPGGLQTFLRWWHENFQDGCFREYVHFRQISGHIQERAVFSSVDVVFWPAMSDPFGSISQLALYSGTPIVMWDMLPGAELIQSGRNGHVLPSFLDQADGCAAMGEVLSRLLRSDKLPRMREHTGAALQARQTSFVTQFLNIVRGLL